MIILQLSTTLEPTEIIHTLEDQLKIVEGKIKTSGREPADLGERSVPIRMIRLQQSMLDTINICNNQTEQPKSLAESKHFASCSSSRVDSVAGSSVSITSSESEPDQTPEVQVSQQPKPAAAGLSTKLRSLIGRKPKGIASLERPEN